jgi:nucleoside-diphosphate-sugar epimerase
LRVLIAGATGVLGRRLVHRLTERDYDIVGLTRDERGDEIVKAGGGTPLRASLFEPDEIVAAAGEVDTIIHAATAIPKKQRTSASDWALNDRIRVQGIESLTDVARRTGAGHLSSRALSGSRVQATSLPSTRMSPSISMVLRHPRHWLSESRSMPVRNTAYPRRFSGEAGFTRRMPGIPGHSATGSESG